MLIALLVVAAAHEVQLNPITRVAELLDNLAKKVDSDEKKEEYLYDSFKCWCMKVINGKSASIDANAWQQTYCSGLAHDASTALSVRDKLPPVKLQVLPDPPCTVGTLRCVGR